MDSTTQSTQTPAQPKPEARPRYETPRIQVMSEREILNTFQLTQSMAGWWSTVAC
jgi:hypothetical protein